jgi:hypothetical protein
MTLLGPADADHYRVKVGRTRWYCDPLPTCDIADATDDTWPSISTVKGAVPFAAADYVTMKRLARTDLTAVATLPTYDDRYEQYKVAEKKQRNIDFNRGSIIHLWAEDLFAGEPCRDFTPFDFAVHRFEQGPAAYEIAVHYKDALKAWFDTYQPELIAKEVVCIHRTLNGVGYGGTADAIVGIENGIYVTDWKSRTSDHDCYHDEAGQVAALAGAEYMIVTDDSGSPVRRRLPDLDGGLIVSIKTDGCRTYPVTL